MFPFTLLTTPTTPTTILFSSLLPPPPLSQERFNNIDLQVIKPRNTERGYIDTWRNGTYDMTRSEYLSPPLAYVYPDERFSVRRKEFWPLFYIEKIFQRFNDPHNIGHESDGLILQGGLEWVRLHIEHA